LSEQVPTVYCPHCGRDQPLTASNVAPEPGRNKAEERLAAGLTKTGVSISIDRQYTGSKHVMLNAEQLESFIAHLHELQRKLYEREGQRGER
jgi:uncharacterized Zn finger protein (UPF0148 family)